MDNLTHTLIGALIGETAAHTTKPDEHGLPSGTRRGLFVSLAAIGSNLPDVDLLYSFIGGKINYLLHHRGHSHTIVGALSLGFAAFAVSQWWLRRRRLSTSRRDRSWMAAILLATPLLHIAMDSTNNYGVHPFWPVYDGWLYGDSVFIAEPLLWAACAPLAFLFRTNLARILAALLPASGVALGLAGGLLPAGVAIAFVTIAAGMLALGRWASPRVSLVAGIAVWLGTTTTFIAASHVAGRRVEEIAARHFPQARLLDHVLTPMPANPVCWEVMLVQSEAGALALRRAMLSLTPAWIAAPDCGGRLAGPLTAPLEAVKVADEEGLKWFGEILTPRDALVRLDTSDCEVSAAMRFIRAPWLASIRGELVLGDLRYDRETALGFAEIEVHRNPRHCPSLVPHWLPPRLELLR